MASIERSEHQPGDLVDIWYDPPNKDTPGWRGLAQVSFVQVDEGNLTVRFQGKTFDRRHQEVRAHVPYLVYLSSVLDHKASQWHILQREVEALSDVFLTVGAVHSSGGLAHRPTYSEARGAQISGCCIGYCISGTSFRIHCNS